MKRRPLLFNFSFDYWLKHTVLQNDEEYLDRGKFSNTRKVEKYDYKVQ